MLPHEPIKKHGKACGLCQLAAGKSLVTCKHSVRVEGQPYCNGLRGGEEDSLLSLFSEEHSW